MDQEISIWTLIGFGIMSLAGAFILHWRRLASAGFGSGVANQPPIFGSPLGNFLIFLLGHGLFWTGAVFLVRTSSILFGGGIALLALAVGARITRRVFREELELTVSKERETARRFDHLNDRAMEAVKRRHESGESISDDPLEEVRWAMDPHRPRFAAGLSDTTDVGEAAFEVSKAICIPAVRLAQIADVLCQSKSSPAEGLTSGQFTAIAQECMAFLMSCCDFTLYRMVGPAGRSRAIERVGDVVNQVLMTKDLWKDTKLGPQKDLIPGVEVWGVTPDLLNSRNAEYGLLLKKMDGDFGLSIEAFAKRIAEMMPQPCADDMHTLSVNQSIEYLTALGVMLTPSLAEKLAS